MKNPKITEKGNVKIPVPERILHILDAQTPNDREALERHILTTLAGAMRGVERYDITDPVEVGKIIRTHAHSG